MKPYYEHAGITIYHGDCRELLPLIQATPCAAVTDPPYNVGISYGSGTDDERSDYESWAREWFTPLMAKTHVVALTPGIVNVSMWCRILEPNWIIAWHKPAAMGRSPFGFCNWEPVLVYGRTKNKGGVDVVTAQILPDPSLSGHPCPKPLAWASGLISRLAEPADTVIDPFSGTGTTLLAAKDAGLGAIGIEIEERYCEIAAKRLAQEVLPFEATPTQEALL